MQGRGVQSLVWEDPTCHGADKPVSHDCWARALEPMLLNDTPAATFASSLWSLTGSPLHTREFH